MESKIDDVIKSINDKIKTIYDKHLYEPGTWGPDEAEKYPTMKAYILGKIFNTDTAQDSKIAALTKESDRAKRSLKDMKKIIDEDLRSQLKDINMIDD